MPTTSDVIAARAEAHEEADTLVVALGGNWRITGRRPEWREVVGKRSPKTVRFETGGLGSWDSSLLLFWGSVRRWCDGRSVRLDDAAMPEQARRLLDQLAVTSVTEPAVDRAPDLLTAVGLCATELKQKT